MKWIVVAIILVIVPYTFITLQYRKPGPAFQPYEDMKNRANVVRLLSAGFQRLPIAATRPADGARVPDGAAFAPAPGGLPEDLKKTLVEPVLLPAEIVNVAAAPVANTLMAYEVQLLCTLPDERKQLGGGDLYLRGDQVVLAPTFIAVGDDLVARDRRAPVLFTIPAGTLKPGRYQVTLLGQQSSRTWPLEVR
jgi:hypothetical protein